MNAQTFSEYWHRVSGRRVALRPGVEVQPQWFRGEKWFVLREPFNNQFFRVSPAAWHFIARLDARRTIETVWEESLALDGDDAPGQEEVIQLLAQLYQSNFLRGEIAADSAALFQRFRRRRQREVQSVFANLLFPQIPLFDPDSILRRTLPLGRAVFSKIGMLVWLLVVGWAVKIACDHASAFFNQSQNALEPGNIIPLYAALVIVKALHECGHALACRRFGGEVHRIGISLVFLTPMPYVDATASWSFRSRWQRIVVSAAGMWVELWLAAIAVFIWADTSPGVLHSLAFNTIFLASVTTLFFNANPLLRYDGYYLLSDLIEAPNLAQRSGTMLLYLIRRYLLGLRQAMSPALSTGEAWLLVLYGIASGFYRVFICASIVWIVSGRWLLLGLLITVGCIARWVVMPVVKAAAYLFNSPQLARCRTRAVAVSFSLATVVIALVALMPIPRHFRAPGVLQAEQFSEVYAGAPGVIAELPVPSGATVHAGQVLARLENKELTLQLAAAEAEEAQAQAQEERALDKSAAEVAPLKLRIDAVRKEMARLQGEIGALEIRAPHDGLWYSPHLRRAAGQWLLRGESAGMVIMPGVWTFRAVVPQEDSHALFDSHLHGGEVRLPGAADRALEVTALHILPSQQQILPSAALGWLGGGKIRVKQEPDGVHSLEPFFEVRATLAAAADPALLRQGRTGVIRFSLPPSPVALQLWRWFGQLIQQRNLF
ncbi:MAG TPA: site-2 protease family protein [Chthoniobacteraceae bacterium]|jgi:putative peptide zinc metalloprotease protein|nr:site-2 protease family protein [Chthoniobacteraceae bacterium]